MTGLLHRKRLPRLYPRHAGFTGASEEDLALTVSAAIRLTTSEHALGLRCIAACIFDEHRGTACCHLHLEADFQSMIASPSWVRW